MSKAIAALGALALVAMGGGETHTSGFAAPKSTFSVSQAVNFKEFELYNAGNEVAGIPLVATLRQKGPRVNWVSYIYGDCAPPRTDEGWFDGGCAPPAEIQNWPACLRNPAIFAGTVHLAAEPEIQVRGVPATFYEDGTRLEIQTGRSNVVIFARRQLGLRIAQRLRGVNRPVRASDRLPSPEPLACN